MDPHHYGNLDPHPDPHQIKLPIPDPHTDPYQNDKLDPEADPYQFADDKPKGTMEYEPILALFQGFEPLF
jgi:hypothetical protein